MDNLRTYLYELSNLYLRTAKQYVHAFVILPGGRYISGSTYQNIANGQSEHSFRGSSLVKPADSYVATVAIGRSKRKK